jgi:hypothetical protein
MTFLDALNWLKIKVKFSIKSITGIWCGRHHNTFFQISLINKSSWYIVLLGREYWIGPGKPGFLNRKDRVV